MRFRTRLVVLNNKPVHEVVLAVVLGATLFDSLQTMASQEQKQMSLNINVKHNMMQARLQAQKTALAGLITAPPSAYVPRTSSLVFNICNHQVLHQVLMMNEKVWPITSDLWVNMILLLLLQSHYLLQFLRFP
jgi:seryl-tRNA(Sec) selenium transferase